MYPHAVLNHDELLTLVHKTQAAARDHDAGRLEADALALSEALAAHLAAERTDLLQLDPADARRLERGQQHVVELVVELVAGVTGDPDSCRCERTAATLLAELTYQAGEERRRLPDSR